MNILLKKLIYKNRFAKNYFYRLLSYKYFARFIFREIDKMNFEEKNELYNHAKAYLPNSSFNFKGFDVIVHFNQKPILYKIHDNKINDFATLIAIIGHDSDVKEAYQDLIVFDNIKHYYDIGANLGHHSLLLLSQGVKVTAFEPNIHCHNSIIDLAQANGIENLELVKKGVGDTEEKLTLVFPNEKTWLGKISSQNSEDKDVKEEQLNSLEVDVIKIDNFYDIMSPPELIKIDTEGFEIRVLEGSAQLIKNHSPHIVFEILGDKENFSSIYDFFKPKGYSFFKLPIRKNSLSIDKKEGFDGLQANYLAIHSSRLDVFENILKSK